MHCISSHKLLGLTTIVIICSLLLGCGAQQTKAKFSMVSGKVEMKQPAMNTFIQAKKDDVLVVGGAVRTMPTASANLILSNRGIIEIMPDSYFELTSANGSIKQNAGSILFHINENKGGYTVTTPHGVTAVLGTVFKLSVTIGSTLIEVKEGKVSFTNLKGEVKQINANEKISINKLGIFSEKTTSEMIQGGYKYKKENGNWSLVKE